jgi:hypothetical protein
MRKKRYSKYMGFLGFIGFSGFQYFVNHNIGTLSYFAFFGFFGYFWINRIANDMVDECYIENARKAKAFTLNIAFIELAVLYIITPLKFINKEFLTVFSAFCFATLIISYSIAFYRYEKM